MTRDHAPTCCGSTMLYSNSIVSDAPQSGTRVTSGVWGCLHCRRRQAIPIKWKRLPAKAQPAA